MSKPIKVEIPDGIKELLGRTYSQIPELSVPFFLRTLKLMRSNLHHAYCDATQTLFQNQTSVIQCTDPAIEIVANHYNTATKKLIVFDEQQASIVKNYQSKETLSLYLDFTATPKYLQLDEELYSLDESLRQYRIDYNGKKHVLLVPQFACRYMMPDVREPFTTICGEVNIKLIDISYAWFAQVKSEINSPDKSKPVILTPR